MTKAHSPLASVDSRSNSAGFAIRAVNEVSLLAEREAPGLLPSSESRKDGGSSRGRLLQTICFAWDNVMTKPTSPGFPRRTGLFKN